MFIFSHPKDVLYILGAQKNRLSAQKNCLTETVLLSTHNIWFGWEN